MDFFSATRHHRRVTDDPKFPSDLADRFQLRMPQGMRDRLSEAAKVSGRSMNAEAVMALEAWLSSERTHTASEVLDADEKAVLGALILDALRSAVEKDPEAPGWEAFRKAMLTTGKFARIEDEG